VLFPGHRYLEGLVIVVSTPFALCHAALLQRRFLRPPGPITRSFGRRSNRLRFCCRYCYGPAPAPARRAARIANLKRE
jgi:hypothetical protein